MRVRRFNSESVAREDLEWALKTEDMVKRAVANDKCLLCRGSRVNSAGLCEGCSANLTDKEYEAAKRWIERFGR